jgi:hypothetical protein
MKMVNVNCLCYGLGEVSEQTTYIKLNMEAILFPKHRFTQDLHGATSQKTAFFKLKMIQLLDICTVWKRAVSPMFWK